MDKLLDSIGANTGDAKLFDDWVVEARSLGLQPNMIQRLKRLNQVYTEIRADGTHWIVRGQRPANVPEV